VDADQTRLPSLDAGVAVALRQPRSIVEVGESGALVEMPIYNRHVERKIERRLKKLARRHGRARWRFPGS
jgi:hypothetical protein